jgi:hypothetical protein
MSYIGQRKHVLLPHTLAHPRLELRRRMRRTEKVVAFSYICTSDVLDWRIGFACLPCGRFMSIIGKCEKYARTQTHQQV